MFGAKLQQSRTAVEIGARQIKRRPGSVRRDIHVDDGV